MQTNLSTIKTRIRSLSTLVCTLTASFLILSQPTQAGYVVTLQEVGSDVVATGSGAIDLTGLTFAVSGAGGSTMFPSQGSIITGAYNAPDDLYRGSIRGPTSFGSALFDDADRNTATGGLVGIAPVPVGVPPTLYVPGGYVSNTPVSDSAIYNNSTFASLGVTPGTYTWTWGSGVNQSFTLQIGSTGGLALGNHDFTQAENVPFIISNPLSVMAGSSVYVAISVANSHTVTRVTDSEGKTLTRAANASRGSIETEIWYVDGVSANSSYSVTATLSGNAHVTVEVAEIQGAGSPSVDGTGASTGHSLVAAATATSSGDNEFALLSVVTGNNGRQSFSAVSPDFVIDANPVPAPGGQNVAGADLGESLSAPGSYTLSANVTGHGTAPVDFAAVAVTIKP